MVKCFAFWLESIVEDDPLPDEITTIIFKVNQKNKFAFIEMLALEGKPNISSQVFCPLEAQFFNVSKIYSSNKDVFFLRIKTLIEDAFDNKNIKIQYKNKKIYLYYNNLATFLFEN